MLWSNSSSIRRFDCGKLTRTQMERQTRLKTVIRGLTKKGRAGFTGTRSLKSTQQDPQLLRCEDVYLNTSGVLQCYGILTEEAPNLRTCTFHFARKVIQTMPLLIEPNTKSDPPATHRISVLHEHLYIPAVVPCC